MVFITCVYKKITFSVFSIVFLILYTSIVDDSIGGFQTGGYMKEERQWEELWKRATEIYFATAQDQDAKNQAARYLSMVTKVTGTDDELIVYTSIELAADKLAADYGDKLRSCLNLADAGENTNLSFKYDPKNQVEIVVPKEAEAPKVQQPVQQPEYSTFVSTMPLIDNFTFEEFVRGPSNSFALAAAQGVVNNPGKAAYNPLFIYGGTGLGKTHLMHAIGNELKKRHPQMAICYLTAETFLNEYIDSVKNSDIKSNTLRDFRNKYRSVDVILIDDVQFLQRGKQVQEEFFNTFQALQQAGRQIVMTSDVAPKNLPQLEDRLISRFEGGMVQEIESPKYETRLAILKKKAEGYDIKVPPHVLEFIAENIKSHVRAMEGALGKVSVFLMNNPDETLDDEKLFDLLKDLIKKEQSIRMLSVEEIQTTVAKNFGVTIGQILSSERPQSLITPRQLSMYIARKLTSKSLQEIATAFGKTHATILHGVKTIESRLQNETELKRNLEEIVTLFGYKMSDLND